MSISKEKEITSVMRHVFFNKIIFLNMIFVTNKELSYLFQKKQTILSNCLKMVLF